jgi:hypothetical protein
MTEELQNLRYAVFAVLGVCALLWIALMLLMMRVRTLERNRQDTWEFILERERASARFQNDSVAALKEQTKLNRMMLTTTQQLAARCQGVENWYADEGGIVRERRPETVDLREQAAGKTVLRGEWPARDDDPVHPQEGD